MFFSHKLDARSVMSLEMKEYLRNNHKKCEFDWIVCIVRTECESVNVD